LQCRNDLAEARPIGPNAVTEYDAGFTLTRHRSTPLMVEVELPIA
jgi:hypothetical protein